MVARPDKKKKKKKKKLVGKKKKDGKSVKMSPQLSKTKNDIVTGKPDKKSTGKTARNNEAI